jgi:all-trans-8'-apo-beta-carotenal 15,15'-oxygenase
VEAGCALFRTFGTTFPGDRLVRGIALEPPVNVSVYPFAGRLLACGEQGLPWDLDPETLETRGPYTFGGALNPLSPFAAHAKIDPTTGELFNFGISFSADQPRLNLYRFDPEGRPLYRKRLELPYPCSLHDFVLGPRHLIFYLAPYLLDMKALAAGSTLMQSLSWEPERGSRLLIADRETGEAVATIPVGDRYSLHTIHAHEAGGRLVVDVVELERPIYDQYEVVPDLFTDVGPGGPVRFVLDVEKGALVERIEMRYRLAPDFPAVDPRRFGKPYDRLWLLGISQTGKPGRKFFDQLAALSWSRPDEAEIWQAPTGHYLGGEPVFLGKPGKPEEGLILIQRFETDTDRSSFLLFDAGNVAAGPRAVLPLPSPMHLGFHAVFARA